MNKPMNISGKAMKELRLAAGYTQRELAERINEHYKTSYTAVIIGNMERGQRRIKDKELIIFAEYFGVLPSELLKECK